MQVAIASPQQRMRQGRPLSNDYSCSQCPPEAGRLQSNLLPSSFTKSEPVADFAFASMPAEYLRSRWPNPRPVAARYTVKISAPAGSEIQNLRRHYLFLL